MPGDEEPTLRDRIETAIRRPMWQEIDAIIADQVHNVLAVVAPELERRDDEISRLIGDRRALLAELERRDERIAELERESARRLGLVRVLETERDEARAEVERLRARTVRLELGLSKIQAHGALSDNEQSMIWTARVALNPEAIDLVPAALRDVVTQRFAALAAPSGNTETGTGATDG